MILTAEERDHFAAYLEETTRDNEALLQHLEGANSLATPNRLLAQKLRAEALACKVVSQMLRTTEDG